MKRGIAGSLGVLMIGAAIPALAAEPERLTDRQLDAVTAGATSGALIFAFADTPGGGPDGEVVGLQDSSGSLDADALSFDLEGNVGFAEIDGDVVNAQTPLSSTSVGVFDGTTDEFGEGEAEIGADPISGGDLAFGFTAVDENNGETTFVTFGTGFDLPAPFGSAGLF